MPDMSVEAQPHPLHQQGLEAEFRVKGPSVRDFSRGTRPGSTRFSVIFRNEAAVLQLFFEVTAYTRDQILSTGLRFPHFGHFTAPEDSLTGLTTLNFFRQSLHRNS